MALDDLTDAERDFWKSRGRNTEALLAENKDNVHRVSDEIPRHDAGASEGVGGIAPEHERPQTTTRPGQQQPEVERITPPTSIRSDTTTESREAPSAQLRDDQDEPVDPQLGHPKRIGWTKFKALQERADALEQERRAFIEQQARLDERLRLINEAMQPDQPSPEEVDPEPDKTQDAYAWMNWAERQRQNDRAQFEQFVQERAARDANDAVVNAYREDANRFAAREPLFGATYAYLIQHRDAQYQVLHPEWTPQQRAQAIKEEEFVAAKEFLENGRSPAEGIYQMARLYGFDGWYADQQRRYAEQASGQGPASGNGAAAPVTSTSHPAAPMPGGAPFQSNSGASSAAQRVEAIAARQAASRSLSSGGGGSPVQRLSAQDLVSMSDAEFADLFSRLQTAKMGPNGMAARERLKELMGG